MYGTARLIMDIRIPRWLARAWEKIEDVVNVELYRRGRLEIRIVDVLLVVGFICCTAYYYTVGGWQVAVTGALMYVFCAMVGLWFLRG